MAYKVEINAAPKQLQEMMGKVLDAAVELGQRLQAVPPGILPAGPTGKTRYMEVTAVGTWTYGGVPVGSNAEGYRTTFWWTDSTWVNNGSVRVKGDPGANGVTTEPFALAISYSAGSQIYYGGNSIFEVLTNTEAGETPLTHPEKFKEVLKGGDVSVNNILSSFLQDSNSEINVEIEESIQGLTTNNEVFIPNPSYRTQKIEIPNGTQKIYLRISRPSTASGNQNTQPSLLAVSSSSVRTVLLESVVASAEPTPVSEHEILLPENTSYVWVTWNKWGSVASFVPNIKLLGEDLPPEDDAVKKYIDLEISPLKEQTSVIPKVLYDLRWREFINKRIININDSFRSGTQQERIQQALDFAEGCGYTLILGEDTINSTFTWNISSSLLIGDDTALIIQSGVKIKFSVNGVVDNIIRNKGIGTIAEAALHSPDYMNGTGYLTKRNKNIIVLGEDSTTVNLEGCDAPYNAMRPGGSGSESWVGDEYGWRTISVLMCGVDGVEVGGYKLTKTKGWGTVLNDCKNFHVVDIENQTTVRNGDGVDILAGSKYGLVEKLRGDTYDDFLFVGSIDRNNIGYPHSQYIYPMYPNINYLKEQPASYQYVHDVFIEDLEGATRVNMCRVMAIRSKVWNIHINKVMHQDTGKQNQYQTIGIEGEYEYEGVAFGDIYNITVNNIVCNKEVQNSVIWVSDKAKECWINDVVNNTSKPSINIGFDESIKVTNID